MKEEIEKGIEKEIEEEAKLESQNSPVAVG